jgi:diguanylate cyclase (GGDEF)-like protein
MGVDRRVVAGGAVLVGFVVVVHVLTRFVSADAAATLVDIAVPALEVAALVLTCLACRRNAGSPYRWTWMLLGLWLAANLFADIAWAWYELVLRTPMPSPSVADFGYLISYPLAFVTVVFSAWKAAGRLRAMEAGLDALMVTLGAAGLAWPLLLAPMLESSAPGPANLISLAYPLGDLVVIMAFASLLLGSFRERPPRFLIVIWIAFVVQVVADSLYFMSVAQAGSYKSGGLLDSLWALVFALAAVAGLMELYPKSKQAAGGEKAGLSRVLRVRGVALTHPRMVLPYLAVPLVGAMIYMQIARFGATWNTDVQVLVYVGLGLVALLVLRQYVTLLHNRKLNAGLSDLSRELGDRVHVLADLTERLEELNAGAVHLNSLRALPEIMRGGLELACSVTRSPAAWITLKHDDGTEPVAARFGSAKTVPKLGSTSTPHPPVDQRVQEVALEARGEKIGALWLLRPPAREDGPDLVQAVGAQLAIAIDNTRRYEEALRLAERDPLTGLLNHRRIHERLALEGRHVQQRGGELSVVMIDLDDFKLLNDTYGHPAGDRVLGQVSEAIRGVLRHTDLAGRVGGDEMMLVLPDTDREGAMELARRLREMLSAEPFMAGKDHAIPLRLSLGVATYPSDADTLAHLVGAADASLYASKQRGGDTITEAGATQAPQIEVAGLDGVASRLMDVVGARDHYTRRHSDQVAAHAVCLGEAFGLSQESLETLRLAAMLHDVGKIGVRTRLLRKPAPLTKDEEMSVRRHINIGERIIRDLPRVAEVLEAVHAHHERYDGSGYPVGLSGEDIPVMARILAVADSYSAMTVDRPYRRKLTGDQARDELLKVAGTQLDPDLVERFVKNLENVPSTPYAAVG